jgi:hypothetical protein
MNALGYLAEWFADEMIANETKISGFDPPAAFVNLVVFCMRNDETLGWEDDETALMVLADLWPDCRALDDVGRTAA